MRFEEKDGALLAYHQGEMLRIESWGEDSLRVRATKLGGFTNEDWALTEPVPAGNAVVKIGEMDHRLSSGVVEKRPMAVITNGRIQAKVNFAGVITFYRDGTVFLQEYFRNYDGTISRESRCLKVINREWKGIIGGSESKVSMLVDEEFSYHCDDDKINKIASWLYESDRHGYPILGNVLIVGEKYEGLAISFCAMSDEQFAIVYPKLKELEMLLANE